MASNSGNGGRRSDLQAKYERSNDAQAAYDAKMKAEGPVENGWWSGTASKAKTAVKPEASTRKAAPRDSGASNSYYSQPFTKESTPYTPTKPIGPGNAFAVAAAKAATPAKTALKPSGLTGPGNAFAAGLASAQAQSTADDRMLEASRKAQMQKLAGVGTASANQKSAVLDSYAAAKKVAAPVAPAVAQSKVISTPVKTAKASPVRSVPMPPERPAGITPSYSSGNAAMAFGPAREKVSVPFSSVSITGGNGVGGNAGGNAGGNGGGLNAGSNSSKSGSGRGPSAGREPGGSK